MSVKDHSISSHIGLPGANFRTLHSFRVEIGTDEIFEPHQRPSRMANFRLKAKDFCVEVSSDGTETVGLSSMENDCCDSLQNKVLRI